MIKPMVVDLEVDATSSDGFYYYCFFIHKTKKNTFYQGYYNLWFY